MKETLYTILLLLLVGYEVISPRGMDVGVVINSAYNLGGSRGVCDFQIWQFGSCKIAAFILE